jgi:hypothetical protein
MLAAFTYFEPTIGRAGALPAGEEGEEDQRGLNYQVGNIKFNFLFDAGAGLFSATNTRFGLGTTSLDANGQRKGTRQWSEVFIHPILKSSYDFENSGKVYSVLSAIGAGTRGDGEAASPSSTADRPQSLLLEDAAIGWKSADVFSSLGRDAIDLSAGNQSFSVGDGFLIYDGTADGGRRAGDVLGHRTAFEQTGILSINTTPIRGDVFHLQSVVDQTLMRDTDAPRSEIVGANIEWFESSRGDLGRFQYDERSRYIGATALYFPSADSNGSRNFSFAGGGNGSALGANREGLMVGALRFGGVHLPMLPRFAIYGEYGVQRNDAAQRRVRAEAWYIEPQYSLPLPWAPRVAYRYAHFSGDSNPNDQTDRSWDPLFPDTGPRATGTWTLGEIYGRYTGLGNSNLNVHQIHVRAKPASDLLIGVFLYRLNFDKPQQTAGVTEKGIMDEIDIYARWTPVDGVTLMPIVGIGRPRDGLRQASGTADQNDRTFWVGEFVTRYKF